MPSLASLATVFKAVLILTVAAGTYVGLGAVEDARITGTTLAALSGTLTGFIMTAISVMLAISENPFISRLRQTGHYHRLLRSGFNAAGLWLCVATLGVASHFVSGDLQRLVLATAAALMAFSLCYFILAGYRFRQVVLQMTQVR